MAWSLTYFDLLPSDINREIEYYKAENNPNNQFIKHILTNDAIKEAINIRVGAGGDIEWINDWFKDNNLDVVVEMGPLIYGPKN